MNLKVKTTFSFSKLLKALPSILDDLVEESKEVYAEMTAENITKGQLRPLRPKTLTARRKGHYWGKKKVSPTSNTRPLLYTGALLKSIKLHKQGIEMNEYGLRHQQGFKMPNVKKAVAPRRFLAMKLDAKSMEAGKYGQTQKRFINRMYKKIGRALKK